MDNKNHKQGSSKFAMLLPAVQNLGLDLMKYVYNEKYNSGVQEPSKNTSKNIEYWMDSDEEFKAELESAVKQYKKNIKKRELVHPKCDSPKAKSETNFSRNYDKINPNKSEVKFNSDVNTNGNASADIQELINYFFLKEKDKNKKSNDKSYIDYEKQGAIPKNKGLLRETQFQTENIGLKSNRNNSRKTQPKVSFRVPEVEDKNSNEYNFIKNSNYDEIVVKINEDICSKPFFYIVPENPSPYFFLSRGSYYIIPETPVSSSESKIIFHPENKTKYNSSNLGNGEDNFRKINQNNEHRAVEQSQSRTNNLGKEVFRKLDSHLNIGPTDVKLTDSYNNLETNHDWNKIFDKTLPKSVNSNTSMDVQEACEEVKLSKKNSEFYKCSINLNLIKPVEEVEVKNDTLLRKEEEEEEENGEEDVTSEEDMMASEVFLLGEFNTILHTLLSEFPDLDEDSAKATASKYLLNEDGLQNYIASRHLNRKMQEQLDRMIMALPETSFEELREKCNEFKGDEELVNIYIQETHKANNIRQRMLDMLFVLPDADPEFLRLEIEKLNGDDNACNNLISELLDSKDYPKVFESPLSEERKKLWRAYVLKFNVKNFILKVPKPEKFAGADGDNNEADLELILKFLESRYPSETRDFLLQTFQSNNKNITKTCESLSELPLMRLSESSIKNEAFSEAFLEEICYIDHREEIDEYLKEMKERKEVETEEARLNNSFLSCPLCSDDELIASEALSCLEGHIFCKECIKRYIYVKISDGVYRFACPLEECGTFLSYALLQEILPENILSNIISKQQAEEINSAKVDGLECCPYCEFAYIPNPEDKIFTCQNPTCLTETCRKCGEKNHIPLRCEEIERPIDVEARKKIEESMTEELVRTCPKCQKKFVKIDGCNKMMCVCGAMMCYICRKQVSGYDHFSKNYTSGKCALYSNNEVLHNRDVVQAGIRTKEQILRENQNIRILYDPTTSENNQ